MNLLFYGVMIGVGVGLIFLTDFKTWRDHVLKACGCIMVALGTYFFTEYFL